MEANKTYILQLKPIAEITEEEKSIEVLATNGEYWMKGQIYVFNGNEYECINDEGSWINDVTHFAVLPK